MEPLPVLQFDGWTLDASTGELVRDGVRVRLQSQPFQVLVELVARPGQLVTRGQLIAKLWPRGVVDYDTALNSAVRRLRTVLGDHATNPRYIETIPKRGYRFVGRLDSASDAVLATAAPDPPRADRLDADSGQPTQRSHGRAWMVAAALVLALASVAVVMAGKPLAVGSEVGAGAGDRGSGGDPALAYDRYVRGRHLFSRRGPGDVTTAIRHFEEATRLEPRFARAWAGLASAYWIETVEGRLPAFMALPKVRDAAERAVQLDPSLPEAQLRLSNYFARSGDPARAAEWFDRAVTGSPNDPLVLAFRASRAALDGRIDEAVELQRRSAVADPVSVPIRFNLASYLYLAGRIDEARNVLQEVRELAPATPNPGGLLGPVLVLDREFDAAVELAGRTMDRTDRLVALVLAYSGMGREDEARSVLEELVGSAGAVDPLRIAEVYGYRGEADEAFRWLEAALAVDAARNCSQNSCMPLEMAPRLPFLASLHADPRWTAWTEAVRKRTGQSGRS